MYGTVKVHDAPATWMNYTIEVTYPARLNVTWEEFKNEFKKAWPKLTKYWLMEVNTKKKQASHLTCYKNFIVNESISYPNISQLLQICIALAPNTSFLERSYSKLEMICSKRRNNLSPETLETLYLLAILRIPVRDPTQYEKEIELLEQ